MAERQKKQRELVECHYRIVSKHNKNPYGLTSAWAQWEGAYSKYLRMTPAEAEKAMKRLKKDD